MKPSPPHPPLPSVAPTVGALLDWASARLAASGSESPRLDAQLLLSEVTGIRRAAMLAYPERTVAAEAEHAFRQLVARREAHEPIAYVLGRREFYGRTFRVDRRVLVPRPETEMLVEIGVRAVRAWRDRGVEPVVVDVGTGSGAIAVSVAAETEAQVLAIDASPAALDVARANAERLGCGRRVQPVQGDLLDGFSGPVHVLLANLPYVPSGRTLPPDVALWEPRTALDGGPDGTDLIRRLLDQSVHHLVQGATAALEIDNSRGARVAAHARAVFPDVDIAVLQDAAGFDRVVLVRRPRSS